MISSGAKWPVLHHGVQHMNRLSLEEKVVGSSTLNLCVDAGAGLASEAWTTSSAQLQLVRVLGTLRLHHWFYCQPTPLGNEHHRNDAIAENTFALFVGMCFRTATFIVGKPDTSNPCSCRWTCSQAWCSIANTRFGDRFPSCTKWYSSKIRWSRPRASEQVRWLQLKQQKLVFHEH